MSKSNKDNSGHRDRLKEKVRLGIQSGKPFYGLHDYEILEYFLFYFLPRIDTKPIAKDLIAAFGSIANVFDAPVNELIRIEGIKEKTAYGLVSFRELINLYKNNSMVGSEFNLEELKDNLKVLFKNKLEENILLITINSKNKIISSEFLNPGKNDKIYFDIPAIIKQAVAQNAAKIIIAHNHPGDSPEPSNEDIINTNELKKTLNKLDIKLIDHFILSDNEIFSFIDNYLL